MKGENKIKVDKIILNMFYITGFWENKLCIAYNSLLHSGALQFTQYLESNIWHSLSQSTSEHQNLWSNTDYSNTVQFIVDYGPLSQTNAAVKY